MASAVGSAVQSTGRALRELVQLMSVEPIGLNLYRGQSQDLGFRVLFGGQALGQALAAGAQSIAGSEHNKGMVPHSCHAYFLRPGDATHHIDYQVQVLRDGKSFSARNIVASQHGQAIFAMTASFHRPPPEADFVHQFEMPRDIPSPEECQSEMDLYKQHADKLPNRFKVKFFHERAIDIRPVSPQDLFHPNPAPPYKYVWMRANGTLPADLTMHKYLFTYASDFQFLSTALKPHGATYWSNPQLQIASLDHAVWFHRPFAFDDWLLYAMESPSSAGHRGYVRGLVYARDGTLVASTSQEGMIRLGKEDPKRAKAVHVE